MPRRHPGRLSQQFPLLFAFGEGPAPLTTEVAIAATRAERIQSVWPFMVKKALAFRHQMKPRESANVDLEDFLLSLWVALADRDHKWEPARGKYITFAGRIIDNALIDLRDKARVVEAPKNASCRLKEYGRLEAAGKLSPAMARTRADIERTSGEIKPAEEWARAEGDDPAAIAERNEEAARLWAALDGLAQDEADVILHTSGVAGTEPLTLGQAAGSLGLSPGDAAKLKGRAQAKLREALGGPIRPRDRGVA